MRPTYTGQAYVGQNNLTVPGCLNAVVNHAPKDAKQVAVAILVAHNKLHRNEIDQAALNTQLDTAQAQLATLEPQAQAQLAWVITTLRA